MSEIITTEDKTAPDNAVTVAPLIDAGALVSRSRAIRDIIDNVLIDGVHYGKQPGTSNIALRKPGAEKLLTAFQIATSFKVESLAVGPEIHYRVTTSGVHIINGCFLGEGLGECSSMEEKYKWRYAISEREYESYPVNQKRIKFKKGYNGSPPTEEKQIMVDGRELANTILKMAKKRSTVDLCMNILAASDIFDRSDDDNQPPVNPKAPQKPRQQQRPARQPYKPQQPQRPQQQPQQPSAEPINAQEVMDKPIEAHEVATIKTKLEDVGMDIEMFLTAASAKSLGEIKKIRFQKACDFIDKWAEATQNRQQKDAG